MYEFVPVRVIMAHIHYSLQPNTMISREPSWLIANSEW